MPARADLRPGPAVIRRPSYRVVCQAFCGRLRQRGNNVSVLRGLDLPGAVLFAANEEENSLARLADAAVGLDLADQFPHDVNRREIGPQEFQPSDLPAEPAVLEKGRMA